MKRSAMLVGVLVAMLAAGANVASGGAAKRIPLWYNGHLVTGLLLHGAEPGQPGFVPLPAAQAKSSNDLIYVIANDPNQETTPEVIALAPGDSLFTGGRWKVVSVVFNDTIAPALRPQVTSQAQILALEKAGAVDLIQTDTYFVCTIVDTRSFSG